MKVLIIVDMLNDFIKPDGALFCGDSAVDIIEPIGKKVAELDKLKDYVISLQDFHEEDDLEFEKFPKHCVKGTPGSNLIPEMEDILINSGALFTIIRKTRYSGFYGTYLDDYLEKLNPDEVEVVGVCTSICVMDTVGGLANRDYKVIVDRKCVADFDPEMHEMSLKRMKNIYGAEII